jgi:hypothetical protein
MEGDHFKDLCVDGRTISECISKNSMGWDKLDLSGSGLRQVAHSSEHSNKPMDSIKFREFVFLVTVSFSLRTMLQ